MNGQIRRAHLLALAIVGAAGCQRAAQPTSSSLTVSGGLPGTDLGGSATYGAGTRNIVTIVGRVFNITLLTASVASSANDAHLDAWAIQVQGDGLTMSFGCYAPLTYSVTSNEIRVTSSANPTCSYTIDVASTPGAFVVNGNSVQLAPPHAYTFDPSGNYSILL